MMLIWGMWLSSCLLFFFSLFELKHPVLQRMDTTQPLPCGSVLSQKLCISEELKYWRDPEKQMQESYT